MNIEYSGASAIYSIEMSEQSNFGQIFFQTLATSKWSKYPINELQLV